MDYLQIALVVLAVAGVWAIVEVALTLRTTRKSITEITLSANNTIEQIQPVISKIDGMVDELDPTNQGGYEWKVENLTASSATVINSRKPVDQPPTPPTPSGKRELPKTGENDTFLTGLAGLSFILAAAYVISPVRRRN